MSSLVSSLVENGSKGRVGVFMGSLCCTTATSPLSCTKNRSARILAIDSGSKVRELSVLRRAAISDDRLPCLHFATSQILPLVTTLSAHSLFARRVTRVSSFRRAVVSSCEAPREPAFLTSAQITKTALSVTRYARRSVTRRKQYRDGKSGRPTWMSPEPPLGTRRCPIAAMIVIKISRRPRFPGQRIQSFLRDALTPSNPPPSPTPRGRIAPAPKSGEVAR